MALTFAKCKDCGRIEVKAPEVKVLVCAEVGDVAYSTICPVCSMIIRRDLTTYAMNILLRQGAVITRYCMPPELQEEHEGDPITWDDVLTFHNELATGVIEPALPPRC